MDDISEDYLMLSGIQHYYFCKRQWCLIHIENQWKENKSTMEGNLVHEKVDNPYIKEKRVDKFFSRGIHVSSNLLKFSGILDLVEFNKAHVGIQVEGKEGLWIPTIVEYKKGKKKKDLRDVVQLVAEVICLEETIKYKMDFAYLYYDVTRTREKIEISDDLRKLVLDLSIEMHALYSNKKTVKAEHYKNCKLCSLSELCIPRITKKIKNVNNYIINNIDD